RADPAATHLAVAVDVRVALVAVVAAPARPAAVGAGLGPVLDPVGARRLEAHPDRRRHERRQPRVAGAHAAAALRPLGAAGPRARQARPAAVDGELALVADPVPARRVAAVAAHAHPA